MSIFSKSKRPFEKQTTARLVTYLYLSMPKIWTKIIFWLWPRNLDFTRFLQTFALKCACSAFDMEIIFSFLWKYNSFSYERLCTWPHFESEGFRNTEVAYCLVMGWFRLLLPTFLFLTLGNLWPRWYKTLKLDRSGVNHYSESSEKKTKTKTKREEKNFYSLGVEKRSF